MNWMIIKILIAGILFGSIFFLKNKHKWILALILTSYLVLLGVNII